MSKIIDITQIQLLRGNILSICNVVQEIGAGIPFMLSVFKKQGMSYPKDSITQACRYLQGKGLIDIKHYNSKEMGIEMDIAYITPEGIDVIESTEPIKGIIFE